MKFLGRKVSAPSLEATIAVDANKGKMTIKPAFMKKAGLLNKAIALGYDDFGLLLEITEVKSRKCIALSVVEADSDGAARVNPETGYVAGGKVHSMSIAHSLGLRPDSVFDLEIVEGPVDITVETEEGPVVVSDCYYLAVKEAADEPQADVAPLAKEEALEEVGSKSSKK